MRNESSLVDRRLFLGGLASAGTCAFGHANVAAPHKAGRQIYVSPLGSDGNPGTFSEPLRSISRAFSAVADLGANDSIIVMPGVYAEQVVVTKGGDASGFLTLRSNARHAAKIRSPTNTYSAVNIVSNYVAFEGFDVRAGGSGHGIEATFLGGVRGNDGPHHINITNNISHDNAGSGISLAYGDFYLIEGNVCCRNCATNRFQGSGISIYSARAIPGPEGDARIFVRRNICYDNVIVKLPGDPELKHSDGNGIIIDDFANSQSGYAGGAYPFRTRLENNLVYRNGGKGVHIFLSNNATVVNNTSYHNNRDDSNPASWRGELSNAGSSNTIWANNIGVADLTTNRNNTAIFQGAGERLQSNNVLWSHNLTFDGRAGRHSIRLQRPNPTLTSEYPYNNILGVDPQFLRQRAEKVSDFCLRSGSPGEGAGTIAFGVPDLDLLAHARIANGAVDLGAIEHQASGGTRGG